LNFDFLFPIAVLDLLLQLESDPGSLLVATVQKSMTVLSPTDLKDVFLRKRDSLGIHAIHCVKVYARYLSPSTVYYRRWTRWKDGGWIDCRFWHWKT